MIIFLNIRVCTTYSQNTADWSFLMLYQSVLVGFCSLIQYASSAVKHFVADRKKNGKSKKKGRRSVEDELAAIEAQ